MRTTLTLAAALAAASAHGAAIEQRLATATPIPGMIRLQFELIDTTFPTEVALRSPTGPWLASTIGWVNFTSQHIKNVNVLLGQTPSWQYTHVAYLDPVEAAFQFRLRFMVPVYFAEVDVAEFIAAGDTVLTMRVPRRADTYNVITWESPNLGVVERTYPIGTTVPEPAGVALLAVGAMMLRRRHVTPPLRRSFL